MLRIFPRLWAVRAFPGGSNRTEFCVREAQCTEGSFTCGEQHEDGFVNRRIFICDSLYFYLFLIVICMLGGLGIPVSITRSASADILTVNIECSILLFDFV